MADRTARIAGTLLTGGKGSGTSTASLTTGSVTPVSGQLTLVWVLCQRAGASNTPTMTGTNGLSVTWAAVTNVQDAGNTAKLTLFRGIPSSAVAGTFTIAFAAQVQSAVVWIAITFTNINTTTNQGVVQSVSGSSASATSHALTLAAQANNANAGVYGAGSTANTTYTPEANYGSAIATQADAQGTVGTQEMQGTASARLDVTPTGTFGAAGTICAIAAELTSSNGFDVLTPDSDVKPGVDIAHLTQSGPRRYRGVVLVSGGFGDRMAYGSGGPTNYPTGDSTGIHGVTHPGSVQDTSYFPFPSQRDDTIGTPTAPSQRQIDGILVGLLAKARSGANTFAIDVKFEAGNGPYPKLVVKANPSLGLLADASDTGVVPSSIDPGTAGYRRDGYAWQTLQVTFTVNADGVVEFWRQKQTTGHDLVWWDNFRRG